MTSLLDPVMAKAEGASANTMTNARTRETAFLMAVKSPFRNKLLRLFGDALLAFGNKTLSAILSHKKEERQYFFIKN
jgi:hypothetical protein